MISSPYPQWKQGLTPFLCRLPVHRMAMMHLLWKLSRDGTNRSEKDIWQNAVTFSLSLGVQSPFTSSIAVRMELMDSWHHGKAKNSGDRIVRGKWNLLV